MDRNSIEKSSQEQAVAAWIDYLNHLRFLDLVERIAKQDLSFESAIEELQKLKSFVAQPEHILGSIFTKHGEIAEHVQVHFVNAEQLVQGKEAIYSFEGVGRLAAEDYLRNGQMVQSKFYFGPGGTLFAIARHNDTYPWFMKSGGTYEIPKSQCQELMAIYHNGETGSVLSDSDSKLYEIIKEWETTNGVKFDKVVRPAVVDYEDVQLSTVHETISTEEEKIEKIDRELREEAQAETQPTLKEGAQVAIISAAIEGGITFIVGVYKKRKSGKKLVEFTAEDWKELGLDTGKGTIKGAIRGSAIYALTNFAAMPAPVASAMITATLGMAAQAYKLEMGDISGEEFIDASESMCLDVTVSALSSILGSLLIPVPILGVVIGNAAGMFMKNIAEAYLSSEEQKLIDQYYKDTEALNEQLEAEDKQIIELVMADLAAYKSLAALAFSPDVNQRLEISINIARQSGVDESRILTEESGYAFFLNQ